VRQVTKRFSQKSISAQESVLIYIRCIAAWIIATEKPQMTHDFRLIDPIPQSIAGLCSASFHFRLLLLFTEHAYARFVISCK